MSGRGNREPPPAWADSPDHIAAMPITGTTCVRVDLERYGSLGLARLEIFRAIDRTSGRATDAPWADHELRPAGVIGLSAEQAFSLAAALVAAAEELERRG